MSNTGPLPRRCRWFLILPLCVAGFAFAPAPAPAAVPPQSVERLDLPGYQARLDRLSDSLAKADGRPTAVSRLRQSLPQAWSVTEGKTRIPVSTAWLASALDTLEENPDHAAALSRQIELRLAAMRAAAADLHVLAPSPSVAVARERLAGIFRRREFRGSEGPGAGELIAMRISRWLFGKIARLLSSLHVHAGAENVFAWVLIGGALLALSFWVASSLARRSRTAGFRIGPHLAPADARHWRVEAHAAAERGDYRDAVHCAYWAAMARLEDLHLLSPDPARTPRESLGLLGSHPDEQVLLADLTRLLERIWYGFRPVSAADWSGARALLEQVECLRPSTARTASS